MKKIFLFTLMCAWSFLAQAEDTLKPTDFAYGIPLQTDGQSSVYESQIPVDVYKGVLRADLGDLRIFNADGKVVPHVIASGGSTEEELTSSLNLNVFPIREGVNQTADSLSVMIKKGGADDTSESEVNVQSQGNQK